MPVKVEALHGIEVVAVSTREYPLQYSIQVPGRPYLGSLTTRDMETIQELIETILEGQK